MQTQQESYTQTRVVQPLDIEDNCVGLFTDGQFFFENFPSLAEKPKIAWCHSNLFREEAETYLSLYLRGANLSEYSSNEILLRSVCELLEAQKAAAITAKLDFSNMCFFDILPDHLLYKWFTLRGDAMSSVLDRIPRPDDYDILHKIHILISNISKKKISVNGNQEKIKYDMFSSATGRLATEKRTFSILNISKEERVSITPKNDMFLEVDLNGAEIRTLLAFSGKEQPEYDIHEFNKGIISGKLTRKDAKAKFFAWLYNPEATDVGLERLYNKKIYEAHYHDGIIETPFGRRLEVDERRALNYLTQSTTSDIVLENAYKIMKFLEGKESFVAFTMHDSIVLDFAQHEHSLVKEIKDIFENNMFGKFLSTVSIGKNYGRLKEIQV